MRRAVGGYKWFLLALLGCAFFFHQADRALFGLLTKPIQDELGLTDVHIGWINTALSWTLAAMTMLAGFAGDRFSRKWIITVSLVFWSLMTVMMGFVGEWRILGVVVPAYLTVMFFRSIATGGGESFYAPSAMALLGAHHKETRSLAFSVHQGVLYFALMTSGLIVAAALRLMDWRHIFMVFGGAGCLLGVSFIWLLRDEPRATRLRQDYGGQAIFLISALPSLRQYAIICGVFGGRSSMAELQPSKLATRVRFPSPAPNAAGVMELVDLADSKSAVGDYVWVRVPPPAPIDKKNERR